MIHKKKAYQIWDEHFLKKDKAVDFAGRRITKGEYEAYGSKSGWTIACILPESQSGTYTPDNIVCCNLKTAMEKGQKFPIFQAGEKTFSIRKFDRHYQIVEFSRQNQIPGSEEHRTTTDYRNATEGITAWKHMVMEERCFFAGYVKIRFTMKNEDSRLLEKIKLFIEDLFRLHIIHTEHSEKETYIFTLIDFDMNSQKETRQLLDHCILFNTYANYFFYPVYEMRFQIYCGMEAYRERKEICRENIEKDILNRNNLFKENMAIDSLIRHNAGVTSHIRDLDPETGFYPYNTCLTKTKVNLKQIEEKRQKKIKE